MKKIFVFYIFCSFFKLNIFSQTFVSGLSLTYSTCPTCPLDSINRAEHINSDFGPRYLGPPRMPYDWHQGVDFNPSTGNTDVGYGLRSIVDGTIEKLGVSSLTLANPLYYVVIDGADHDFGYVHIFPRNQTSLPITSGGFQLVNTSNLAGPTGLMGIITPDSILLSDCTSCAADFYVIAAGDTLWARNSISAGDFLAPLGNSGTLSGHLHLNRYENMLPSWGYGTFVNGNDDALDPLEHLEHWQPNFDVSLHNDSINLINSFPMGFSLKYPGNVTQDILVRPKMANEPNGPLYDSSSMNISKVLLEIKNINGSNFALIQGPDYVSKIYLGATDSDPGDYPDHINVSAITTGNWNRTGIMHFAYMDGIDAHPAPYTTTGPRNWDDYYFADFVTRLQSSHSIGSPATYADYPSDSRYNDGKYELKAKVTDVKGTTTDSPVYDFILDNFKPFLDRVAVFYENDLIYSRSISGTDPMPTVIGDGTISYGTVTANLIENLSGPNATGLFNVTVNVSEPLDSLTLEVNRIMNGQTVATVNCGPLNFNKDVWACYFSDTSLVLDADCLQLNFDGVDCSGNKLLQVIPGANNSVPARQNTLNNATTWSAGPPEGMDHVHNFCLNSLCARSAGPVAECVDVTRINSTAFPASDGSSTDGAVALNVGGANTSFDVEWTIAGSSTVISTNQQITNLQTGIYCWTLTDLNCCTIFSNCIEVQNCSSATPLMLHTVPYCRTNSIDLQVSGGIPPYTYEWSHPSFPNLPSTQDLHAPRYGSYCVEVTDACGQRETICQEVGFDPQLFSVKVYDVCLGPGGLGLIDLYSGGTAPAGYDFIWSNGTTDSDLTGIEFPGEFCVTITNASNCETTECYFVNQAGGEGSLQAMTSSTCYAANEGTIALTNVSNALSFQWDNGATSHELNGLDAGEYCVTVTSDYCADISQCFEVTYACCSEIEINLTVAEPSSCNANDGAISPIQGGSISGGVMPLTYNWNTGHTGSSLQDLGPGFYSLTVTDAIGCTGSANWDLNIEEIATLVVAEPACEGEENGVGIVIASNSGNTLNPTGDFKFSWSDGFLKEGGSASTRDDLAVGSYTVTITDGSTPPCDIIVELEIGEIPSGGPLAIQSEIIMSCANAGTGEIIITPSGGNGPYYYNWSNGIQIKDLKDVDAGTYNLTINDACDRELIQSFELNAFTEPIVELADYGGCDGEGWAQVNVSHAYDYEIEWKNVNTADGFYLENILSEYSPEYVLNDTNGCEFSGVIDIYLGSALTNLSVFHTCEGLAEGGFQALVGVQDLDEELLVKVNQQTYTFTPNTNPYLINIGGLNSGSKDVRITNGDCIEDYDIVIENLLEQGDLVGLHFDEDLNQHFCEYERECEGQGDLPTTLEPADIDYLDNRRSCKFPVFCGDTDMETKVKFKKQKTKAFLYRTLLEQLDGNPNMVNNRFPPNFIGQRMSDFNGKGADDCDWIKYCPVNLQITDVINNPSSTSLGSSFNGGCPIIVCQYASILGWSITNDHSDFCFQNQTIAPYLGLNIAVDLENFIENNVAGQCFLQTNRLIEVWRSYQAGNLDYLEDLESTQLYTDIIEEHLNEFQAGARYLNCSKVRWCANDGTVDYIEYTPEELCMTIVPTDQNYYSCDTYNDIVYCHVGTNNFNFIVAYVIQDDIGLKSFDSNEDIFEHQIVNITNKDEYVNMTRNVNLLETDDTSFVYSNHNYLRETYYGMEHVDFFNKKRFSEPDFLTGNIKAIYSNDIIDQDIYVHDVSEFEKVIEITTDDEEDFLDVVFQTSLEILSVDQYTDKVVLHFYHQNEININGNTYSGDEKGTLSVVSYNLETNELEVKALHDIDRKNLFLSKHDDLETIVTIMNTDEILYSEDFNVSELISFGLYNLNISDLSNSPSFTNILEFAGSFISIETLDFYSDRMLSFVIHGKGLLDISNLGVNLFLDEEVNYVAIDFENQDVFHKAFNKDSFSKVQKSMVSNSAVGGWGLAVTFTDDLRLANIEYLATGNSDLIFFRYDSNGNIMQEEKWGKPSATIELKEFVISPFNAYFGGHVLGISDNIIVGNQKFIYYDDFLKHSFMASQELIANDQFKNSSTKNEVLESPMTKDVVSIYPNPAQEDVTIELLGTSNLEFTYNLYTVDGRLVKSQTDALYKRALINLQNLAAGVFIVELIQNKQKTYHKIILTR